MSFTNFLKNLYFEDKGYLTSQFTFGFEFESFIKRKNFNDFQDTTRHYWRNVGEKEAYKGGYFGSDGTIDPDEDGAYCDVCGNTGILDSDCFACNGTGNSVPCLKCHEQGSVDEHCKHCDGEGVNLYETKCTACHGRGKNTKRCSECGGRGFLDSEHIKSLSAERKKEYLQQWSDEDIKNYRASKANLLYHVCPECKGDGTVSETCPECEGASGGSFETFEWKSPVLKATPVNFGKAITFLKNARAAGCRTNESCGFHVHIGFPDEYSSVYDINWAILQMLASGQLKRMTTFKDFNFERTWANSSRLQHIRRSMDELSNQLSDENISVNDREKKIYKFASQTFSHRKEDIVSQHGSGTMEWRGPTGIMNSDQSMQHISDFFQHLAKIIAWLGDLVNTQTLKLDNNIVITKQEYLSIVKKNISNITFAKFPKRKNLTNNIQWYARQDSTLIPEILKSLPCLKKITIDKCWVYVSPEENTATIQYGTFTGKNNNNVINKGDYDKVIFDGGNCEIKKCVINDCELRCNVNDSVINSCELNAAHSIARCTINKSTIKNQLGMIQNSSINECEVNGVTVTHCNIEGGSLIRSSRIYCYKNSVQITNSTFIESIFIVYSLDSFKNPETIKLERSTLYVYGDNEDGDIHLGKFNSIQDAKNKMDEYNKAKASGMSNNDLRVKFGV